MSVTVLKLGASDQGRRMRLADFEDAEAEEGCILELSRGIIVVSQVPQPRHGDRVYACRRQLQIYDLANPGRIHSVLGGGECKFVLTAWESERHPDLAVYTTPSPCGKNPWGRWTPDIVIEIVSPGSEERDYVLKREEYLEFGIKEYWILDPERREMLVHRRVRKSWEEKTVTPPKEYTCRALPGLEFDCGAVFQAAEEV
jgi:Uma2 family endonuclease